MLAGIIARGTTERKGWLMFEVQETLAGYYSCRWKTRLESDWDHVIEGLDYMIIS